MRRAIALIVALAAVAAGGAATAQAAVEPYSEGPGESPIVRPLNDVNVWYWRVVNAGRPQPIVACFRYRIDNGPDTSPFDGKPYAPPPGSTLPNGCDPTPVDPGAAAPYRWSLRVPHRSTITWCVAEYRYDSPTAGSKLSDGCTTTRIDSQPPVVGITLSDARGRQGATNDAGQLRRTITYADDTSPAWGDTRICRITDRACQNNGVDSFDYVRDCSDEPLGLTAAFSCNWSWPEGDRRVYQCALAFDSAVGDRAPDMGRAPAPDNPDYTGPGSGNFAFACGSIVIDRAAPRIAMRTEPSKPRAGHVTRITARTDDGAIPGSIGPYRFDFGDGTSVTSASRTVRHTYAKGGNFSVSISAPDAAGNRGLSVRGLTVNRPHPLDVDAPTRMTTARTRLPVKLHCDRAGSVKLTLERGTKTVARRTTTFRTPAVRDLRIALPKRLRTGRYELRAEFTKARSKRVSERAKAIIKVTGRR